MPGTNLPWEPSGAHCYICGYATPHGWLQVWLGGHGYQDVPCCAWGEGHLLNAPKPAMAR